MYQFTLSFFILIFFILLECSYLYSSFVGEVDISQLVIPFSKAFKSYKPRDLYPGNENIPFKEREPEFKMILRQEFI